MKNMPNWRCVPYTKPTIWKNEWPHEVKSEKSEMIGTLKGAFV